MKIFKIELSVADLVFIAIVGSAFTFMIISLFGSLYSEYFKSEARTNIIRVEQERIALRNHLSAKSLLIQSKVIKCVKNEYSLPNLWSSRNISQINELTDEAEIYCTRKLIETIPETIYVGKSRHPVTIEGIPLNDEAGRVSLIETLVADGYKIPAKYTRFAKEH